MYVRRLLTLIALCLLMGIFVFPATAASITVTTLTDAIAVNGLCSLREAVINANNNAATHADCIAGAGVSDTITLNDINGGGDELFTLTAGEISVTSAIIIQEAAGAVAIISGNNASRVFNISTTAGDLALNGITVQNGITASAGGCIQVGSGGGGALTFNNGILQNCATAGSGGAIGSTSSTHSITITGSTLQGNTAEQSGGAVSIAGVSARLSISDSAFTNNRSGGLSNTDGGAIRYAGIGGSGNTPLFSISNTTFTNNRADSNLTFARGGAISASATSFTGTISGSTFTGNQAFDGTSQNLGGAIYMTGSGALEISSSVFTGNSVTGTGAEGGAIYHNQGSLTVTTSRIQSNIAPNGGAIFTVSGTTGSTASVTGSCIVDNDDTAVVDTEVSHDMVATGNWWGTAWGPLITGAGGNSALSNGDSISGDGVATPLDSVADVDVGLTNANATPPTGDWLTSAPTVAGAVCQTCTGVSSTGHARVCS